MIDKPRHRSGYSHEETEQVVSVCLTVIATLNAYVDDLCIVGGLVPALLIDHEQKANRPGHPGSNDLDVGLAVALLDDQRYAELSERLRREGFGPDKNRDGRVVRQRWRWHDFKVTIDFLIPPAPGHEEDRRLQDLEPDFAALVTRGLDLAFEEQAKIELDGFTLKGEKLKRTVPVCGPGAFIVLKAFAFADRVEPKDAFDLVYVIDRLPGGPAAIADRLTEHTRHGESKRDLVVAALGKLRDDFAEVESVGPRRAAEFGLAEGEDLDAVAADAHGHVDDLLRACRNCGLID